MTDTPTPGPAVTAGEAREALGRRPRRGGQGRRRAGRRRLRPAGGAALPRPRADGGRARAWRRRCWCAASRPRSDVDTRRVQFTPDLMPGDITGSMVIEGGGRRAHLPRGPGVHQPAARRRDQPDAAEDPVGAAGGDGGGAGLRRRRTRPLPTPVPGGGDPEPGRVRGHLPAARGPARPVPAQGDPAAARARRRARHRAPARRRLRPAATSRAAGVGAVAGRGAHRGRRCRRCARCGCPPTRSRLHRRHRPGHPAVAVAEPGRQPARRDGAAARRPAAWAWLTGRDFVTPDDVKALAHATLAHRLALRPEAELEGVDVGQVLATALGSVPVPR